VFLSALERPDRSEAWLEQKRGQEGKTRSLRNYPRTAEEAFASTSEPYFAAELLEAAQQDAPPPAAARKGDRYLKAWDIGRKDASVCVVLRAPSGEEAQLWQLVAYERLVGQEFPAIQRTIEATHRHYPGPTVIEANGIGKPLIQNLRLPQAELIEHTTTRASKQAMLTAIELALQAQTLKIHPDFRQLLGELADYRLPDDSITQDSVIALGLALSNAQHAHALASGGRLNRKLLGASRHHGPPPDWYDRQKITTDALSFGLVHVQPPPGSNRGPRHAEAFNGELERLLSQGWTVADPAVLERLGLGHLLAAT
jgi:hypothetical protein